LLQSETADVQSRVEAARALLSIDADKNLPLVAAALGDSTEPALLREQMLVSVGEVSTPKALDLLDDALQEASYKTQKEIALALTNTPLGIDKLLASAGEMQISPRLLFDRQVKERLQTSMSEKQKSEFEKVTAAVKPPDEEIQELINQRLANFDPAEASLERGEQVFVQQCAPCHQIRDEGGSIGPQLDGIGSWGAQALTEKILDPNRNISKAFINYTIEMKNGNVRTGLFRREEGQLFVFANAAGQEFSVPKNEVAERKPVPYTLMPDHFGEVIPEDDYYALLAYLLNQK
jgi:putative heme-binding domain-containing protein